MKLPYYISGAQLARAVVDIREGRPVEWFLRMAVAEMPKAKPRPDRCFVVTGFNDHLQRTRDE